MKFVWPESIQGLGQQAGKLNLKIELYFCGLNLKYMRGGGPRRGYYVHYVFYSYVVVLPPASLPPPTDRLREE
jgi:hypothetical protein